ncbi:putative MaoC-like dehydratase [Burkholderiales bacterium]|nr:putative MaoC-like dehydratase [Burkholderiales bacterium]
MIYFEDFIVGARMELGTVEVSADEIVEFARRYDPQPFHIDPQRAGESIYGGLIASGWHTCAMVMRLACDAYLLDSASLGSPGVEKLEWLKPVRPGDRLTAWRRVLESRPSRSDPRRGSVYALLEAENQNAESVLRMHAWGMFRRRPS